MVWQVVHSSASTCSSAGLSSLCTPACALAVGVTTAMFDRSVNLRGDGQCDAMMPCIKLQPTHTTTVYTPTAKSHYLAEKNSTRSVSHLLLCQPAHCCYHPHVVALNTKPAFSDAAVSHTDRVAYGSQRSSSVRCSRWLVWRGCCCTNDRGDAAPPRG